MSKFKPSVEACKGCRNLIWTSHAGRRRQICAVSDRIPGNMTECPLHLLEMDRTMAEACRVSPENSCRNVPIANFVDALILCGGLNIKFTSPQARKDREEYQEIISCIVKAARKHGYEIPEEEA